MSKSDTPAGAQAHRRLDEAASCKRHEMPCHHQIEEYMNAYLHKATLTGAKSWLFCTCAG